MSDRPRLDAAIRTATGKTAAARLRREGRLPAVLFGHGRASQSLSVDAHELSALRRHATANTLVDLSVEGHKPVAVLIHGVATDRVSRRPLHVDLFAVRMGEELTTDVPLVGDGVAPAVDLGGTLVHPVASVRIRALPKDLPQAIHYDLSSLTGYDQAITVADLTAPHGVTIQTDAAEVIARVLAPRVEEAPVGQAAEAAGAPEAQAETEASSAEPAPED